MPTYVITAPDGKEYEVTAPEGATQDQVLAYARDNYQSSAKAPEAPVEAPKQRTLLENLGRGAGLTARAGITGVAAVPAMFADFLSGATNLVTGQNTVPNQSQALQDFLTAAGLPVPENTLERGVQAGIAGMAGAGSQIAAAAKSGIKALAPLAENAVNQIAAAGAGGFAGQMVGEKVAKETESPLAGTIASLATGITAGGLAGKAASKLTADNTPLPTLQDIKNRAQARYGEMESQGVAIKPLSVQDMLTRIRSRLDSENFNPEMDTHRPVAQLLTQLNDMIDNRRVSFPKLEQMRSAATALKTSNDAATRKYAGDVVTEIDQYINRLSPGDLIAGKGNLDNAVSAVTAARKDWRNLSRAQVLEDAFNIAEARALDPKASESELIRRQLINILADKKKMAFFSEREQNAIKSVVKGGAGDTLLSLVARFNPERNQIVAGGQTAMAMSNPLASAGSAVAGFTADKFLSAQRSKAVQELMKQVASGQIKNPQTSQAWRGLLSAPAQPISEQDLEAIRALR